MLHYVYFWNIAYLKRLISLHPTYTQKAFFYQINKIIKLQFCFYEKCIQTNIYLVYVKILKIVFLLKYM